MFHTVNICLLVLISIGCAFIADRLIYKKDDMGREVAFFIVFSIISCGLVFLYIIYITVLT